MKIIESIRVDGSLSVCDVEKVPLYRGTHPNPFRGTKVLYMHSDPDWDKCVTKDLYGKECAEYYHEWHSFSATASWCKNIEIFTGEFDREGIAIYKRYKEYYTNKREAAK